MDDDLMARESGSPDTLSTHITADKADGGLEIGWQLSNTAVDLRAEVVEEGDGITLLK